MNRLSSYWAVRTMGKAATDAVRGADGLTFGERLKKLRGNATRTSAARAVRVPGSTIHDWEEGRTAAPADENVVRDLADHYGCSLRYLTSGEGSPPASMQHPSPIESQMLGVALRMLRGPNRRVLKAVLSLEDPAID